MNGRPYVLALNALFGLGCGSGDAGTPGSGGSLGGDGAISGAGGSAAGSGGRASAGAGSGATAGAGRASAGAGSGATGGGGSGSDVAGTGGTAGRDGSSGAAGGSAGQGGSADDGGASGSGGSPAACGICATYAEPREVATVNVAGLDALSGIAVSRLQPDIILAHNDHDRPVVYALDFEGREHARFTLEGAPADDIEDIAVGPCGAATCVYLADIGDNNAQRTEYAILRFVLPEVPAAAGSAELTPAFERFRFTYEDGSHNAESLMVGPDGTVYVVTKLASGSGGRVAATGPSSIYRLPSSLSADSVVTATQVVTLTVPADGDFAASAAAAHPCGLGFLLRTYDKVYEFTAPAGMGFEAAFTATPTAVAMPDEPQSEGIDYRADGRGFITSGEGTNAIVVQTDCSG